MNKILLSSSITFLGLHLLDKVICWMTSQSHFFQHILDI